MADDPINIIVVDNVDSNVETKLNAIADAADKGTSNLDAMRSALASIRGDALTTLREQATTATAAIKAELDATNALSTANTGAKSATASLAAEVANSKSKIDAETAALNSNTTAAKANSDAKKASFGANHGAAPLPTYIADAAGASQTAENYAAQMAQYEAARTAAASLAAEAAVARAAVKETTTATEGLAASAPTLFARFKSGIASAADGFKDIIRGDTNWSSWLKGGAKDAGEELEKLSTHSRGSSTAIRELLVIAREGGRGDLNRMAGSASILAGALGLLPIAISAAIVGFVALTAARTTLNTTEEKNHLKEYAESLGLSEKEMRKLSDTTVDANGKMHEHNMLQVTYADVFAGTITTIKEGIAGIATAYGYTTDQAKNFTTNAITFLKIFFTTLVGEVGALLNFFYTTAYNLVTVAQNVGTLIGNFVYLTFATVANKIIGLFNTVGDVINLASNAVGRGDIVKSIAPIDASLGRLTTGLKSLRGEDFFADVRSGASKTNAALDAVGKNILKAAEARVKAEADAIRANRNAPRPKKETDPKTKDDYLDDENLKLDNQIKLFGMLKDAREVQNQLDSIQEAFAKRRTPLNSAELQQFRDKLTLIQQNNKVQADMDKIYQEFNGPQQALNIGLAATNKLLAQGNLSARDYAVEIDRLNRTFDLAVDPMFALNEEIDANRTASRLAGDELDKWNNKEKVRLSLLAKGFDLRKQSGAFLKPAAKAAADDLDANDKSKYITGQVASITDPLKADAKFVANKQKFYDQIDALRKKDVLSESQAEQAKAAVAAKYDAIKLQGAESFFNALTGLSSSKNQILATIGKAAAVADATIKGYQAVQNALASVPPPFNIAVAAATGVAAAVQVANIISTPTNVGSYWTGGDFIVRGKTGVDANRISMNVSDGERVTVQTQAQQQAASNDNKSGPAGDTHVHNYFDEASFIAAMDSHAGEKVVMNIITRKAKQVKATVK